MNYFNIAFIKSKKQPQKTHKSCRDGLEYQFLSKSSCEFKHETNSKEKEMHSDNTKKSNLKLKLNMIKKKLNKYQKMQKKLGAHISAIEEECVTVNNYLAE